MLFFYRPLENFHCVENLNFYYEYFFDNLFENEPININELIHNDFQDIYNTHRTLIGDKLRSIHQVYLEFSENEKTMVRDAYENNRQIQNICNNLVEPIKYEQLPESISQELKKLYNSAWTLLSNKDDNINTIIKDKCGNIYEHYCSLFQGRRQIFTICPVCGLEELLGEQSACSNPNENDQKKVREAYDHYFPKKLYPFISISFSNLIPICHHCNSDYKHDNDTAFNVDSGLQQECFFPFSNQEINEISISIIDAENMIELYSNDNWNIELSGEENIMNKIHSWNRIFLIKDRYKKRIKEKEVVWLERLVDAVKSKPREMSWEDYKIFLYKDVNLSNQASAVVQKAYYDYFFENLLDGYLEEVA